MPCFADSPPRQHEDFHQGSAGRSSADSPAGCYRRLSSAVHNLDFKHISAHRLGNLGHVPQSCFSTRRMKIIVLWIYKDILVLKHSGEPAQKCGEYSFCLPLPDSFLQGLHLSLQDLRQPRRTLFWVCVPTPKREQCSS